MAPGSLAGKIAWANPQFVGATVMALLWLHAMRQAAAARRLSTWLTALLWATCLTIIICVFVNPGHLFRGDPALDRSGPILFLDADYGPSYLALWIPFTYGLLFVALITLARAALHGPQIARARCRLLVVATVLPMLIGLPFIAGVRAWPNFNPAVSSLSLSAILCAVALVRYQLLDLTPMARETVIKQLTDPLVVADARGLLCDFNPAASTLLAKLSRRELGRSLEAVLAGRVELLRALQAARGAAAAPVREAIVQHHERLDDSGYPSGLGGDDLIPEARVIAVADVLEAMVSHRPYRPALPVPAAAAELRAGAGVRYDAEVVAACMSLIEGGSAFSTMV